MLIGADVSELAAELPSRSDDGTMWPSMTKVFRDACDEIDRRASLGRDCHDTEHT
jgi:hypothetical protein